MHKHLKKFGFAVSKNPEEEIDGRSDGKIVKYLYKNEATKKEKSHRNKSRNYNELDEQRHRSHRRSTEHTKHREPELIHPSDSEGYTLPAENSKKRKKKSHKPKEGTPEQVDEEKNKKEELAKLIKKYKALRAKSSKNGTDDGPWLLKKEIMKLIPNSKYIVPKSGISSSLLRKFFVFDKKEPAPTVKEPKKRNRYKDDNTNAIFSPIIEKKSHKSSRDDLDNTTFSRKCSKNHHPLILDQSVSKDVLTKKTHRKNRVKNVEEENLTKHQEPLKKERRVKSEKPAGAVAPEENEEPHRSKNSRKKKSVIEENAGAVIKVSELEIPPPKKPHKKKSPIANGGEFQQMQEIVKVLQTLYSVTNKEVKQNRKEQKDSKSSKTESKTVKKAKLPQEKSKNNVNPLRHELCLVKNTFSIVEIPPAQVPDPPVEKKKKSKAFKRYYQYDNIDNEVQSDTYQTYSDSHKVYQETSDHSEGTKKQQKSSKVKKSGTNNGRKLKVETHVSAVVISPEKSKKSFDGSANGKNSRIPVLSKPRRMVESIKRTISSPRKNVSDKNSKTNSTKDLKKSDQNNQKSPSKKTVSSKSEKPVKQNRKSDEKGSKTSESKNSAINKRLSEESRISKSSSASKQSKTKAGTSLSSRPGTRGPPPSSSVQRKESKKPNRTPLESKSDTRIAKPAAEKTVKTFQRSSTKASFSNSTFYGDKSTDSSLRATSFLLTKTYRDDDKLSRWRKTKMYADTVRRNLINKNQKAPTIAPQVMEVRYFTVTNNNTVLKEREVCIEDGKLIEINTSSPDVIKTAEFEEIDNEEKLAVDIFNNDLPKPCIQFMDQDRFDELFQLPTDDALNEILNENYNFLKKDFSYTPDIKDDDSSGSSDLSSNDSTLCNKKFNDWYDFTIPNDASLSDFSYYNKLPDLDDLNLENRVIDSSSAPGSEESGYATIKSRPNSNFFKRPEIKALLNPPSNSTHLDSYFVEVQVQSSASSLEIRSIESKALQTVIECSQKSIQIKLSQEEIPELVNLSEGGESSETHELEFKEETFRVTDAGLVRVQQSITDKKEVPEVAPNELSHNETDTKKEANETVPKNEEICNDVRLDVPKSKKEKKGSIFLSCITCISRK